MGMDLHIWQSFSYGFEEVARLTSDKKIERYTAKLYKTDDLFDTSGRLCWPLWDWCKNNLEVVKTVDVDDIDVWELSYDDVKLLCDSAKKAYEVMAEKIIGKGKNLYSEGWKFVYDHWQEFDVEAGSKYFQFYQDDCEELDKMKEMYIWVVYTIAERCHVSLWCDHHKWSNTQPKYFMVMSH